MEVITSDRVPVPKGSTRFTGFPLAARKRVRESGKRKRAGQWIMSVESASVEVVIAGTQVVKSENRVSSLAGEQIRIDTATDPDEHPPEGIVDVPIGHQPQVVGEEARASQGVGMVEQLVSLAALRNQLAAVSV